MAKQFLIIDGYNLMHAAGMARASYGPGDLADCRRQLLRFLQTHLTSAEQQRTTVVFDAREPPPGSRRSFQLGPLSVLYAEAPGDADVEIENLIAGHSAPKQVKLISSDHRLQIAASRRKAKFLDSEEWIAQLERREDSRHASTESKQEKLHRDKKLTDEETDYCLSVFDEIEDETGNGEKPFQGDLPDIIDEDTFE